MLPTASWLKGPLRFCTGRSGSFDRADTLFRRMIEEFGGMKVMNKLDGKFVPLYINPPSCNSSHWKSNPSWEVNAEESRKKESWLLNGGGCSMMALSLHHAAMWSKQHIDVKY